MEYIYGDYKSVAQIAQTFPENNHISDGRSLYFNYNSYLNQPSRHTGLKQPRTKVDATS